MNRFLMVMDIGATLGPRKNNYAVDGMGLEGKHRIASEDKNEMTKTRIRSDLFRKVIKRRGENTEALEKKEKGDFKVKRFTPLNEKENSPQPPGNTALTTDDPSNGSQSAPSVIKSD